MLDHGTFSWLLRKLVAKSPAGDWLLYRLLRQHRIAVISHGRPLVSKSLMASVGWIPDFQHVHLPEYFTKREKQARDWEFMELCVKCDKVIVSSECALADLRAFAPQYAWKGEVLQFVATPPDQSMMPSLAELQQRYNFAGPYFLLPNQFWVHKNHSVVIAALTMLKQQNRRVVVLATGGTGDHRRPKFFSHLMRHAKECDVVDRFRVLGVVEFNDLSGLMQHTVALINPSHFEGWSTSVEESKSMGKQILLSDIPVHREQAPALGVFFNPNDAEGLARCMWNMQTNFDPESDCKNRELARTNLPERQLGFARTFQRILLSVSQH
jgi:hypothetical protein